MPDHITHCENCGCRHYIREHGDRILEEKFQLGQKFKEMRAQHAREIAEWEIRAIQHGSEKTWLQQKTKKQAGVINRLEERIRNLGRRPYEKHSAVDLEPGDLLFGNTIVVTDVRYYEDQIQITGQFAPKPE